MKRAKTTVCFECVVGAALFVLSLASVNGCGGEVREPIGEQQAAVTSYPDLIYTWTDLKNMTSNGNYLLMNDLDGAGQSWTPKDFEGTFDGGNKKISNLTINLSTWVPGGFFASMTNAKVRRLRLVNLKVNGGQFVGGLAGASWDSVVEDTAIEMTITGTGSAGSAGGVYGDMIGGSVTRTYTKGSITGRWAYAGGFAGTMYPGVERASINQSYAQTKVTPDTPGSAVVTVGGIAGYTFGPSINDVYVVGNVTGRGAVGGLVGNLDCYPDGTGIGFVYRSIYRGEAIDQSRVNSNGWSGALGVVKECLGNRVDNLFYDTTLDRSSPRSNVYPLAQIGGSTDQLKSPTTPIGGIYCVPDVITTRCGDNSFTDPPWNAGSGGEHHTLRNMPGPNPQPK